VSIYPGASVWWFAVTVSGLDADTIASVELKDAEAVSSYALMTNSEWAFTLNANGAPFATPISIRVTNEAGQSFTAAFDSLTGTASAM